MVIGDVAVRTVPRLVQRRREHPRWIAWIFDVCIKSGRATVSVSWSLNNWRKETRNAAGELGLLGEWQMLVDSLVVAGNEGLGPYSR